MLYNFSSTTTLHKYVNIKCRLKLYTVQTRLEDYIVTTSVSFQLKLYLWDNLLR